VDLDSGEYTYFPEDYEALPTRPVRALQHVLEVRPARCCPLRFPTCFEPSSLELRNGIL
jgi:hypothetical protein